MTPAHKEELDRFKLRSTKTLKDVRYIPGLKRRLISVGQLDEEGYHVGFGDQQWKVTKGSLVVAHGKKVEACIWLRIGMSMLASKINVLDVRKSKFIQKAMALHLLHQSKDPATMILLSKTVAGVAFGVAERFSRTFRVESTGLRAEAPKMLWADLVSTTYLIYCIPYVLIGLRIPEEEWRGKDTSLAHLKVFGCDSFVKVKYVCGEAMKCTFIGNGSDEMRYSFRDTKSHQVIRSKDFTFKDSIFRARFTANSNSLMKPIQKSQVVLLDILENLAENDSIVAEHRLGS
ncbi:retrovirus-related pol polyprotein from transposon TNT 1-94 [Tanacetum coccineum]